MKKPLVNYEYDFAYGPGTAADPDMVMLRIACEGRIMAEIHMLPDDFLSFAHSVENVARGVFSALNTKPVPRRRPNPKLANPVYESPAKGIDNVRQ